MNYDQKNFRAITNTNNGETSSDTVFHYHQTGEILTGEYRGGEIVSGQLLGLVDLKGNIKMNYHHINQAGEIKSGTCKSTPELLENGKIRLHESWQWSSGEATMGESIIEEI